MIIYDLNLQELSTQTFSSGIQSGEEVSIKGDTTVFTGTYETMLVVKSSTTINICGKKLNKATCYAICPKDYYNELRLLTNTSLIFNSYKFSGYLAYTPRVVTFNGETKVALIFDGYVDTSTTAYVLETGSLTFGNSFKLITAGSLIENKTVSKIGRTTKNSYMGKLNTAYATTQESTIEFATVNDVTKNPDVIVNAMINGFHVERGDISNPVDMDSSTSITLPSASLYTKTVCNFYKPIYQLIPKTNTIYNVGGSNKFNFNGTII
jgi:hypothetical protein